MPRTPCVPGTHTGTLFRHQPLDPRHGLLRGICIPKGSQADIPLTRRSETGTRSRDDIRLLEQDVEELPGPDAFRSAEPGIGAVDRAVHLEPGTLELSKALVAEDGSATTDTATDATFAVWIYVEDAA